MDIEGNTKDHRRAFNTSERVAMFLASNGKCSNCGCELRPGWHADHIRPYSKGGETDVINGQALCPKCNLKKGDKLEYTYGTNLRDWQIKSFNLWMNHKDDIFLCVAFPGSGKTRFALACAKYFMQAVNTQVIVVCPSSHLKRQWADDAHDAEGIKLDYKFENKDGIWSGDFNGICTTYASVAKQPDLYRKFCSMKNTMVILDEIHHAGEKLSWGDAIREAFSPASKKLSLSGTPVRSDNKRIPFINYEAKEKNNKTYYEAIPDVVYSYVEAQDDDVCRQIYFPNLNGSFEWIDKNFNTITCEFSDKVKEEQANNRLRTALEPDGDWLKDTLVLANDRLDAIRQSGHPEAGGLVLARDNATSHAQDIANILASVVGRDDVDIATSDDINASDIIKNFKTNNKKWLVAIKMVSEGVDIPRLRVAVHATNVTTSLFFRQAVGRICRYQSDVEDNLGQAAWYYIPADQRLVALAEEIRQEVIHSIEETGEEDNGGGGGGGKVIPNHYEFVRSVCGEENVISDIGTNYSPDELYRARQILNLLDRPISQDMLVVDILRLNQKLYGLDINEPFQKVDNTKNLTDTKKDIRKRINKVVSVIANKFNIEYFEVHDTLNKKIGCNQPKMTLDQLHKKLEMAEAWLSTKPE